mmetsp:Transcript_67812/g.187344  ORF Transcript_67812/g.187344 Transcript_67812/m.187344 type:complete len:359 (-) Transcript_67812:187-1263(-)
MVIELLNRMAKVFKDYCGVLSEEAIRKNFILIYELLDEILDYGYPQGTSTETLKNFIYNEPIMVDAGRAMRMPTMNPKTTPSMAAHKPITYQRERTGKQKNEIFVDILERLNVLFSPSGLVLNSTIDGCIQMKSYLSGNPELRLALNEDLVIGKGGAYGSVTLDDCNFHECVQLQDFETSRTLSFIPPDGEFVVLNYRVTGEFRAPFRVFPAIDEVSPYKLDVTIRCRADIPETNYGANVVIRIPVPRNTASAGCELAQNAVGQQAEFSNTAKHVTWTIKKFQGNTEQTIRVKITLSDPATTNTRKEIGPISLNFEVPMYNVSNLAVRYLRIAEQGKAYNPYRWVRYVTQSNSYVCRI